MTFIVAAVVVVVVLVQHGVGIIDTPYVQPCEEPTNNDWEREEHNADQPGQDERRRAQETS